MSNYLVQATVVGTSNPVVTRLMSIPADATFEALNSILDAAFGWREQQPGPFRYSFRVIEGNYITIDKDEYPNILLTIYECDESHSCRNCHTIGGAADVKLNQVFDSYQYREHDLVHTYDRDLKGPMHAVHVLGRTLSTTNGKAVCLGGQGHTWMRMWIKAQELKRPILSTWDLDLNEVNARMAEL